MPSTPLPTMVDFFISYNGADKDWATWVASVLEEGQRYTTIFQARDFRPGENFVLRMQEAMRDSEHTLAVLSNHYLAALFTQSEWTSAFQKDPTGKRRALIPVRVAPCELPPPFNVLIYCDLFGLDEPRARQALLAAVSPTVSPSPARPPFPGNAAGMASAAISPPAVRDDRTAARLLLRTLESTLATFEAQIEVRDELAAALQARLPGTAALQYEDLFSRHHAELTPDEARLHRSMRQYTEQAMYAYNRQALDLVRAHPHLRAAVPEVAALERHLEVWMDKYQKRFMVEPQMALCYVGVHEQVPFPQGIEAKLRAYLKD